MMLPYKAKLWILPAIAKSILVWATTLGAQTQEPPKDQSPHAQDSGEVKRTSQGLRVEETEVTGKRELEYYTPKATTATRTTTPLLDIPQSVQVIDRKIIEEQGVTRAADAVRNVSGVLRRPAYLGLTDSFTIRGFDGDIGLWNGFRRDHYYSFTDVAALERIEVLKGPSSVLYGQLEPGGVVNYVTKRPTFVPYHALEFTAGSFDFYRPTVDLSGPLNKSKSLRYRLNAAYENADSFRDFVHHELYTLAPVIDWDVSSATKLSFDFNFLHFNGVPDRGFFNSLGPIILQLPRKRFLYEPKDRYRVDQYTFAVRLDHQFNQTFSLRSGFASTFFDDLRDNMQTGDLQPDGRTVQRTHSVVTGLTEHYKFFSDLTARFTTGPFTHLALVGVDLLRYEFPYTFRRGPTTDLDIFNPVYGAPRPLPPVDFKVGSTTDVVGVYAQNQIDLTHGFKLLGGVRFDATRYTEIDKLAKTTIKVKKTAWSPRVGLVYQPRHDLALYFSYSEGFRPNTFARTLSETPVDPESSRSYEVGVKTEAWDGRINSSLAVFRITKENVAVPDPADPSGSFFIQTGEQRSQGIEYDVAAELLDGWRLIANYAYIDARVTKDTAIPTGNRLTNVPYNSGSFWSVYEFQQGWAKGFSVGGGVYAVGRREAELPNSYGIPGYTRLDAMLSYRWERWKFALNFKNLADKKYYDSQGNLLYPGAPFTIQGTFSVNF